MTWRGQVTWNETSLLRFGGLGLDSFLQVWRLVRGRSLFNLILKAARSLVELFLVVSPKAGKARQRAPYDVGFLRRRSSTSSILSVRRLRRWERDWISVSARRLTSKSSSLRTRSFAS